MIHVKHSRGKKNYMLYERNYMLNESMGLYGFVVFN